MFKDFQCLLLTVIKLSTWNKIYDIFLNYLNNQDHALQTKNINISGFFR